MPGSWRDADLVKEMTLPMAMVSVYSSLGGATYGWDANYWGGILGETTFIRDFGVFNQATGEYVIPSSWQSAGSGAPTAATAVGCLIAGLIGNKLGRIKTLYVAAVISIVGIIIQSTAYSFWQLLVGRMVNGLSMGIVCNVVPNYQAECAPSKIRGSLVNMYQFWLLASATMAVTVNYCLNTRTDQWAYRVVIILQVIIPVLLLVGGFTLPESPRWLIKKGRFDDARKVLIFLRRGTPPDVVEEEVRLLAAAEAEQEKNFHASTWMDCFRGTNLRRTAIATGVQCLQQAQGNSFIMNYATIFLQQVGITDSYKILCLLYFVNCISSAFAFYFSDRIGRRPLLLGGAIVLGVAMFIVAGITGYHAGETEVLKGALAALFIWQFTQALTWGSCVWIVTAEVSTLQLREKTITIATFAGFAIGVLVTFINPFMQNAPGNLEGRVGFIYAAFSIAAAVWITFMLPETKGKSLEELDVLFEERVSVWTFGKHVTDSYGARLTRIEAGEEVLEGLETPDDDELVGGVGGEKGALQKSTEV